MGDGETLKVLKLIPENTDYVKTIQALYGGAVLGFYDPKTKRLLVRANGTTLTPEQRITVAHEMDHALTDQTSVLKFVEDNWVGGQRIQPGGSFDTIAGTIQNMFSGI